MENVKNNTKTKQLKQFKLQELEAKREQLKEVQEQALANLELIKECEKSSAPHTYELGKNLMKIVKDKLYMAAVDAEGNNYKSFKKYVGVFLEISDKYVYMLINAAKVQDLLSGKSVAPENISEKLLRKLVPFLNTPEKIAEIWKRATNNDNTIQPSEKALCESVSAEKSITGTNCSKPGNTEKLKAKTLSFKDCVDILRELSSGKSSLTDEEIKKFKQKIAKFIDLHNKNSK